MSANRRVYALLCLVMLLWAGNSIVARAIHDEIPPFTLALCRWVGAFAIVIPFAWRRIVADWPQVRRHWPMILLLGAIGVGSFNAFLYSGLRHTTATNGLLIQAAIPAFVLLFDLLIFGLRPRLSQVLGVIVSAIGVAIIVFRADVDALLALSFGTGDALILCAVVVWALYTALLRRRPPIHQLSFLALTFLIGACAMLPFAIGELQHVTIRPTPSVLGGIAYVAILPSVVAYFLYNRAVAEIGGGAAGQTISLQPLFGALLAAALLGESLHAYHLAGMTLIILGIAAPLIGPISARRHGPPARRQP